MNNIINPGEGEKIFVLTDLLTIKVSAKDTASHYSVIETLVPPTGGPPLHRHAEAEIFYVLEGIFAFILGEKEHPQMVQAGSVVHVPSKEIHTFKNIGETAGKLLVMVLPGNLEHFFRSVGSTVEESALPDFSLPPDTASLDPMDAVEAAPRFGLEFMF